MDDKSIKFTMKAKAAGREITPETINFPLFNTFNKEVEQFLAGTRNRVPMDEVHPIIEHGSYRLNILLPVMVFSMIQPDLGALHSEDGLKTIDTRRATIVKKWQERAKKQGLEFSVFIESHGKDFAPITISRTTDYHLPDQDEWVAVEKYLRGRIVDLGGTTASNVHIELDGSKKVIVATTTEDYLHDQNQNYLYHQAQVHLSAMENIRTGELINVNLISFVGGAPSYDEKELKDLIAKGTKAWADVPDSAAWVREQRG